MLNCFTPSQGVGQRSRQSSGIKAKEQGLGFLLLGVESICIF
jgi:hypothetical protein